MNNTKGQGAFVGIMIAFVLIITVIVLTPLLKDQIQTVRSPTYLDCSNNSISTMNKATCVMWDTTLFYYSAVAIGVAIGAIGLYAMARPKRL